MKELQEKVKKFCKENNMDAPIEHKLLDTMSELGEVAKEILLMSEYGKKKPEYKEELKMELGDLFYSLITIANTYEIDLKEALSMVLDKYNKRIKN